MRVLVACEESQAVTKEFRAKGHEAFSCDIEPCSGGHPEWHIQRDVLNVLSDGWDLIGWDLLIAFPPCTYLTVTGNKWMNPEYATRFPHRLQQRIEAIDFFMAFAHAPVHRICIENPVGIMSTRWRKPDQIIQPYHFGDTERKTTCLWLKSLPLLQPTNIVEPELYTYKDGRTDGMWHVKTMKLPQKERATARSKTFPGIAQAMATQWG